MSNNDIIYQSKGALIQFLVSEGFQTGSDTGNITGSALDNEIAVWSNPTTIEGDANFTWDNTLRVTGAFFVSGDATVSGDTTLGDASGDTVTINAQTIDLANVAAGTDNTVLIFNGSTVLTDEIDPKVWAGDLVDYTGTPADNELAIFTDVDTVEGDSNLTWNGSTLDVGGALTVDGNTTLGDASGDSVTINAETIVLSNVDTGTDDTVLVYDGSSIVTDEIDSKVWAGKLIDYTGTPADSQIGVWTDTDTLEGNSNFTYDGAAAATAGYLDIKNTVDDGTTNRTMLRLHNYRTDDADVNDFGPISIDFDIENLGGGTKTGTARITAVQCPIGTDHTTVLGEKSSGLLFSTMEDDTLAEAMRINAEGYLGIGTTSPSKILDVSGDIRATGDLTVSGSTSTVTGSATITQTRLIKYTGQSGPDAMTVFSNGTISMARGNVGSPSVQTVDHEGDGDGEWTKIMSATALSSYWAPNVVALVTLNPMGFGSAGPGEHYEFIVTARWARNATASSVYTAHTDITVEAVNSAAINGWDPATDIILTYNGITAAEIWIKGLSNYTSCEVTILGGTPAAQPAGSWNPPGWQIEPYQNSTWATFSSLGTDVYGTWVSKALTNLVVTGSVVAPNIGADTDNTVVILNSSGYLKTDEIDSRVWGTTLVDGTNGTDNEIAIFTDSNSVEGDANLTYDGTNLAVSADSDAYAEIGRTRVGYGGGYSDYAWLSHVDQTAAAQYALAQHANGTTYLNATSGQAVYFRINNTTGMSLDSSNNVNVANELTVTTQPAFSAYGNAAQSLSAATWTTIEFNTENYDVGGDFNTTTDTFTAPTTGKYILSAQVRLSSVDSSSSQYVWIKIITSNRTYYHLNGVRYRGGGSYSTPSLCVVADMDASDTAYVQILVNVGTCTTNGSSGANYTGFQGYLLG